jgi:hypothetical protein
MTVYNWFTGEHTPQVGYVFAINDLIDKL